MYELERIEERDTEGAVDVTMWGYPTRDHPTGGIMRTYLPTSRGKEYYLAPGPTPAFESVESAVADTLEGGSTPVVVDGELAWFDERLATDGE